MKKIAILNCLNANDVCAGVGCLSALNQRRAHFNCYQGMDVELCAFLRCSQCQTGPEDPGMLEKLERLKSCGVETVHIGICTRKKDGKRCPYMEEDARWLEEHGIPVVWGTH